MYFDWKLELSGMLDRLMIGVSPEKFIMWWPLVGDDLWGIADQILVVSADCPGYSHPRSRKLYPSEPIAFLDETNISKQMTTKNEQKTVNFLQRTYVLELEGDLVVIITRTRK